jgi:hypothetical protein
MPVSDEHVAIAKRMLELGIDQHVIAATIGQNSARVSEIKTGNKISARMRERYRSIKPAPDWALPQIGLIKPPPLIRVGIRSELVAPYVISPRSPVRSDDGLAGELREIMQLARRLSPSHRDPERFHLDKSELVSRLTMAINRAEARPR